MVRKVALFMLTNMAKVRPRTRKAIRWLAQFLVSLILLVLVLHIIHYCNSGRIYWIDFSDSVRKTFANQK